MAAKVPLNDVKGSCVVKEFPLDVLQLSISGTEQPFDIEVWRYFQDIRMISEIR